MEMKQNQTIFHGTYPYLTSFFIDRKILKYFKDFKLGTFQFHCKSEHKQIKRNKITRDMCESDIIIAYLQSSTLFKRNLEFIF